MKFLLFGFFVLAGACTKQSSPDLGGHSWSPNERTIAEQCSEVKLERGLLQRDNVQAIFRCQKWQTKFPELYAAIGRVSAAKWDHVFLPIQKYFYNDRAKRDEFFGLILEIDQKKGLDDLSEVMASVMRSNFYDTLARVFRSADTQENTPLNKTEIKDFLKLLNADETVVLNWMRLVSVVNRGFSRHLGNFKQNFNRTKKKPIFEFSRVQVLDRFFKVAAKKDFNQQEKELSIKVLTKQQAKKTDMPTPWLHDWYRLYTYPQMRNFLNVPANDYPLFLSQLKQTIAALPEIECSAKDSGTVIMINLEQELRHLLEELTAQTPFNFFQDFLNASTEWLLSQSACKVTHDGKPLVIDQYFNGLTKILADTDHYDAIQFAQIANKEVLPDDPFKLHDFLSSDFFIDLTRFTRLLLEDKHDKSLLYSLFNIFKEVDPLTYFSTANLVDNYFDQAHLDILKGLGKFWAELKFSEKQFLLNIFDTHFQDNIDTKIILQLYLKFVTEAKTLLPYLSSQWTSSDSQLETTFNSILMFAEEFKGPEVLKDLRGFYSRDQILEVLRVIGNLTAPPNSDVLSTFKISSFPGSKFAADYTYARTRSKPTPKLKKIAECIGQLFSSKTIIPYMQTKKSKCKGFSIEGFAFYFIDGLREWLDDYRNDYDQDRSILSSNGLFSSEFIFSQLNNVLQFNRLDLDLGDKDSEIENLMNLTRDFLFKWPRIDSKEQGYLRELTQSTELLNLFLNSSSGPRSELVGSVLKPLLNKTDQQIRQRLEALSQHLTRYSEYRDQAPDYARNMPCERTLRNRYGVEPCQRANVIKPKVHKLIHGLIKRNGSSPTLLKVFTDWLIPHVGIRIPFEKPNKRVPFSLKTAVSFFWDFYVRKHNETIRYREKNHEPEGDDDPSPKSISLVERLGIVVRDVRFNQNKLGAHFLNSLAKSDDIPKTLRIKRRRIKLCATVAPQCSGGYRRRLAKNARDAFSGLEALAHNYPHKYGPTKNYQDFAQATFTTFVMSSSKKAQESDRNGLLPRKKYMKEHNFEFLLQIMNLDAFTNISRFVHSRFGVTEKDFFRNLKNYEIDRLERNMFHGLNPRQTYNKLNKFIVDGIKYPDRTLIKRIDQLIDWLDGLNFEETRLAEASLKNIAVLSTYIGNERLVSCGLGCDPHLTSKEFKGLSPKIVLDHLGTLLKVWEGLDRALEKSNKQLVDALPSLFHVTQYLVWSLNKERPKSSRFATWKLLNEIFQWTRDELLMKRPSGSTGLDEILAIVEEHPKAFVAGITGLSRVLKRLHYKIDDGNTHETKAAFKKLSRNIQALAVAKKFNYTGTLDYLRLNIDKSSDHYMELPKIVASLQQVDKDSNQTKFYKLLVEVFDKRYSSMLDWIKRLVNKLRVFEPTPHIP